MNLAELLLSTIRCDTPFIVPIAFEQKLSSLFATFCCKQSGKLQSLLRLSYPTGKGGHARDFIHTIYWLNSEFVFLRNQNRKTTI